MKLSEYLSEKGLSAIEFASNSGLSVPAVYKLTSATGSKRPEASTIEKVEKATNGLVSAYDLLGISPTKPKKRKDH
jgi:transcriptional regulator with XRE-family HTH domain